MLKKNLKKLADDLFKVLVKCLVLENIQDILALKSKKKTSKT